MKRHSLTALLLSAALLLGGCDAGTPEGTTTPAPTTTTHAPPEETTTAGENPSQNENETDETEVAETEIDYDALSEEEYRALIVERSLLTTGNTARMENVLRRAKNGEEITVAYVGGSITEGLTAGAEKCWARLSYEWLCETLPEATINYVNAGMSGTPSTLGVIRAERDVLAPEGDPDIVFIEFAVNDGQDALSKNAYESLVRRMLSLDRDTAVVLLFTVLKNGYSCETAHMKPIGEHYDLPMISVGMALNDEFASGRTPWETYSDDESHPNEWGHVLVKDFVAHYFETILDGLDDDAEPKAIDDVDATELLYGADYTNVHLLDRESLTPTSLGEYTTDRALISQFPNGWSRKGGDNEGIEFEITFKDLFLIYQCNNSPKFGTAEILVDSEFATSVSSSSSDGWNNPVAVLVYSGDEVETHTVTVKMTEGSEDTYFGILGFGYSD
ncbi:MAG: SGNH/GDSL hydrolase family protein [Bacteroides sp.]|nr:SGNH/GDSL hydrolase family protein [Eubacterium sp.]MCM1419597.1 SGNH/GDSL hydrolase family protein [Roseburia sp.]MCM1463560.1 SGNH/GDSL hydrolase family protein [Bacteroides sp.]